jgi:hypothetical protein
MQTSAEAVESGAARTGEIGIVPMRTDRFFAINSAWFFATREGASIGPYENKSEAHEGLADFLDFIRLANPPLLSTFYSSLNKRSQ